MIRKPLAVTVLLTVISFAAVAAQPWVAVLGDSAKVGETNWPAASADLRIREFVFTDANDKAVRVHIVNTGGAASVLCILRLTVRKINGVPVGRVADVKLPPLAPGKDTWMVINAKSILPNNVSLESTTFKLNADANSIVTESDEANNEVWHNL